MGTNRQRRDGWSEGDGGRLPMTWCEVLDVTVTGVSGYFFGVVVLAVREVMIGILDCLGGWVGVRVVR